MNNKFYNIPAVPIINKDLVMEVGRYIDFHYNNSTNTDNTSRLSVTKPGNLHFNHSFILDNGSDFRARNLISDNGDLNNIIDRTVALETKNTEQDTRLDALETKNTEQDTRLTNIETNNTEQDTRLTNIESKNTEQDEKLTTIETDLSKCAKITVDAENQIKTLNIGNAFIKTMDDETTQGIYIGTKGTTEEKIIFGSDISDTNKNNYIYDNLHVNGKLNVKDTLTINNINIFDIIYPINSIYLTFNQSPPIFGTWELIIDGHFLRSTTEPNLKIGGSSTHTHTTADHTLTVDEIPSHAHSQRVTSNLATDGTAIRADFSQDASGGKKFYTYDQGVDTHNTGGGKAHNHGNTGPASNLPPFITCYMYMRVA